MNKMIETTVPSGAKLLILETHPQLGGEVRIEEGLEEKVKNKLAKAGLDHVEVLVLKGTSSKFV